MHEIELKFQIPATRRAALARAVATASSQREALQALYFDTAERDLARSGIALRLRKEGRQWVQTLKAAGANSIERLEHNVPVAWAGRGAPALDPTRHAGTPPGERLAAALAGAGSELRCLYRTDIVRCARRLRSAGAQIELAHDVGHIVAGDQRLEVNEIEFELLSGTPAALLRAAAPWVTRHALWLDVRSKAERGDRLARGVAQGPACKAEGAPLADCHSTDAALRAMLRATLQQVLANAAEVAGDAYAAEHVHQLRVGLRRLRSVLRELQDWSAALPQTWEPALAEAFGRLGGTRDADVIAAQWRPRLEAAGLSNIVFDVAQPADTSPGAALREPAFQRLLLELLAFASTAATAPAGDGAAVQAALAESLQRQWRRVRRDAARFGEIDDDSRHRVRKRLKRLRYIAEFAAPLFKRQRATKYLAALREAQEALGAYNDDFVARAFFSDRLAAEPRLWFCVGWIDGRREAMLQACERTLEALADARRFWRS